MFNRAIFFSVAILLFIGGGAMPVRGADLNKSAPSSAFDGVWTGHASQPHGPSTDVEITIKGGQITGTSKYALGTSKISGTVGSDGSIVGGIIDSSPISGTFSGSRFTGSYVNSSNTPRFMILERRR